MLHSQSIVTGFSISLGVWLIASPLLTLAQEYQPPRRGTPGRREGAGTRGPCVRSSRFLMPLIPQDGFSITVSKSPTLFWSVPATAAKRAEFKLVGNNDQELYRQTIELSGQAGVVGLTLPDRVTEMFLKPNQDFRWQFSLICDPNQPSKNPFVEGVIQRHLPEQALVDRVNRVTNTPELAAIYASAGVWQEAVSTLATRRCLKPTDSNLITSWANLLKSVRLDDYVTEPIVCSPKKLPG